MDANGARHLMARLAIGVPVGARFEVVQTSPGTPVHVGDTGTLMSIEDGHARLSLDIHGVVDVDPHSVTLRRVLQQTA
jgi:hypothetical protein